MGKFGFIILLILIVVASITLYHAGSFSKSNPSFGSLFAAPSGTKSFFDLFKVSTSSTPLVGPTPPPATTIGPAAGSPSSPTATSPTPNAINPQDIPPGFTAAQLSPYFHQIRFGSVSYGPSGQISIMTSFSQGQSVDVTGWEIHANYGGEYLPQAVNIYDPSGLAAPSDIRLKPGDILNLYATSAPTNLRLNECTGYLNDTNQYSPQLPNNCPYLDRGAVQYFTGACQNYLSSIGACQQANLGDPRIPQNDYSCRDYIANHFTYHSCFEDHEADANFLSNEVRAWMGASPVDQFHDRVLLLDRAGLLVDIYTY